ncbi:MAG: SCO family protein [Betaproteobacteria bacterium]
MIRIFLVFLTACMATGAAAAAGLKAGVFEPPRRAPEFSLRGSDGAELNLGRYRGKVVLLAFGFTHCTEVCPVTLAVLAQARKKLGTIGNQLQVVYVTVDPERDNAERMKKYLSSFDTTFIGGTGKPEQLAAVRSNYGIVANKVVSPGGYSVDHSSSVYLIDGEGRLRAMMPYGHGAEDYVHDVVLLLKK